MTITNLFYHSPFFSKIFPTLVYCLKKELADCQTVLDLGCGPDSPISHLTHIKFSLGVDTFKPYIKISKKKKIHSQYRLSDILNLKIKPNSFDAVILIDVLEHLSKSDGRKIIKKASLWANKKVIINTPNGFLKQNTKDDNPNQIHRSGWSQKELKKYGFKISGLGGLQQLHQNDQESTMFTGLLSTIRYRPKLIWFIITCLSQIITYHFPHYAFEFFAVKKEN